MDARFITVAYVRFFFFTTLKRRLLLGKLHRDVTSILKKIVTIRVYLPFPFRKSLFYLHDIDFLFERNNTERIYYICNVSTNNL